MRHTTAQAMWQAFATDVLRSSDPDRAELKDKEVWEAADPQERKAAWVTAARSLNRETKRALYINSPPQFGHGSFAPSVRERA